LESSPKNILAQSEWWFLERLDYVGARVVVELVQGVVSSVSENVSIDGAGTVPNARPIEVTDNSRRVRVKFLNVLAYQVTDESYGSAETGENEEVDGRILNRHRGSAYLQYVLQSTLVKHLVDNPVQHYSLNLADDIIDVITTTGPTVELI